MLLPSEFQELCFWYVFCIYFNSTQSIRSESRELVRSRREEAKNMAVRMERGAKGLYKAMIPEVDTVYNPEKHCS